MSDTPMLCKPYMPTSQRPTFLHDFSKNIKVRELKTQTVEKIKQTSNCLNKCQKSFNDFGRVEGKFWKTVMKLKKLFQILKSFNICAKQFSVVFQKNQTHPKIFFQKPIHFKKNASENI